MPWYSLTPPLANVYMDHKCANPRKEERIGFCKTVSGFVCGRMMAENS